MTDLLVRPATAADDVAVGELLVHAFAAQYARKMPEVVIPPERVADLRDQAAKRAVSTVLVAERDRTIVGTVALYRWGAPGGEAWIEGAADLRLLAIDAAYHGQGLSRALLDAAERTALEWTAPAVCLHVRRGVTGVARLYQARGYTRDPTGDLDDHPPLFLEGYWLRLS